MKITINRFSSNDDATLSAVNVDGKFECFGLEDEYREVKVANETRIPAGVYDVNLRTTGGFHQRYLEKFPDFHKGMLQVMDVPDFEYILIHIGNTDDDTAGCLILGQGANSAGELSVASSTYAYKSFYKKVINSAINGSLTIEYIDGDR